MGIADAILDLVSSGTTLKENNLKEIEGGTVLESQVSSYQIFWPELAWSVVFLKGNRKMLLLIFIFLFISMACWFWCHSDNWTLFRLLLLQAGSQWSGEKECLKQHTRCLKDWRHIWGPWGSSRCIYIEFIVPHLPKLQFCIFFLFHFLIARFGRLLQTWEEAVQRKWLKEYWANHL